jgi:hypothetical protein
VSERFPAELEEQTPKGERESSRAKRAVSIRAAFILASKVEILPTISQQGFQEFLSNRIFP